MKNITCFFLVTFTLASCHSVRHAASDQSLQAINSSNSYLLAGKWNNHPVDDQRNKNYASTFDINASQQTQLLKQFFLLDDHLNIDAQKISLLLQKNVLRVTAINDDKILAEFDIKGKLKKGYFKTKKERKTAFPPLPPFYYFNENVRLYITVDKNNNLVIKRSGKKTGMIFLFSSGFNMDGEYRYAPVDSVAKK